MSQTETCPRGGSRLISCAVMAHPRRAAWVEDLLERLDGPAVVVWDEGRGEWDTARRALAAHDPRSQWHLVIQDDGLPCRDLFAGLSAALEWGPPGAPDVVLGLYAGTVSRNVGSVRKAYEQVEQTGAGWMVSSRLWWGVATLYPVALIPELVRRCDQIHVREYDRRVSSFLRRRGIPIAYTVPSLVEHRDGASLLHHDRADRRRAQWYAGEDVSALDLDWARPAVLVKDPRAPHQQVRRISRRPGV